MICALLIGREGSSGFPGKNLLNVLGRPLCAHPMIASAESFEFVDRLYVSTDSESIRKVALTYGAKLIDRPPELASKEALGEDAYKHGFDAISKDLEKEKQELELLVLLMCNAPTINGQLIDEGIEMLRKKSGSGFCRHGFRLQYVESIEGIKKNKTGFLEPFVPFETFDEKEITCDRNSQGEVFLQTWEPIARPRCFTDMESNLPPQKWMEQNPSDPQSEGLIWIMLGK